MFNKFSFKVLELFFFLGLPSKVFAYNDYYSEVEPETTSAKAYFYRLINSGFGTIVILVLGLGGFAALMITRQGKAGKDASMFGIIMLLTAVFIFILRVFIRSGVMGQEYLEW